jgi:hypothetical protein
MYAHYSRLQGVALEILENCAYIFGMEPKRTRGRPPKGERAQEARLYLRTDETEKRSYEKAAEIAGLDLSEWVRARLNAAARREINRA